MTVKELIIQLLDEDLNGNVYIQFVPGTPYGAPIDGINMNNSVGDIFLTAGNLKRNIEGQGDGMQ